MCSILCTNKNITDYDEVNEYLQYRGPDDTTILSDDVNNFTFVHNLLSMTGEVTTQPFVDESIICLYNLSTSSAIFGVDPLVIFLIFSIVFTLSPGLIRSGL